MSWNEPYVDQHLVEISGPQKVVTTPKRYHPGMGDLVVYLNGFYAIKDKEYKEITPYSVEFVEELEAGDNVAFHYQKLW